MSRRPKISLSPEKVAELKEKYGVSEDGLRDILGSVRISPESSEPMEETSMPAVTPDFMRALSRGEIGIGEALMMMDFFDRRERREMLASRAASETEKQIGNLEKQISDLSSKLEKKPKGEDEDIKALRDQVAELAKTIETMKEKTLEERIIDKTGEKIQPIQEAMKGIQERIDKLAEPKAPKGDIEAYVDGATKLKAAGILKEGTPEKIVIGEGGIPVSGSIPAAVIYIPEIVDKVLEQVDKRFDKWGFAPGSKTTMPPEAKELIKLPPKPPETRPPVEEPTPPPIEEKPPVEAEVTKIEAKVEPEPEELVKLPPKPEEVKPEKPAEAPAKEYPCICGEKFATSLEKARHTKTCPKAKEEREKKAKKNEQGKEPEKPSD